MDLFSFGCLKSISIMPALNILTLKPPELSTIVRLGLDNELRRGYDIVLVLIQ